MAAPFLLLFSSVLIGLITPPLMEISPAYVYSENTTVMYILHTLHVFVFSTGPLL
jgi:hypothetical protein